MHVPQTVVILRHEGVELARVTLPPGEYVIGRNPDVEISVNTPLISRRHARLTIQDDLLLIEDLGSSNGTFVNEQLIAEATRLLSDQPVRLGDVQLELHRQRSPSQPAVGLAPTQASVCRFLPAELLAEQRYQIGKVVAQGGMGAILEAQQAAMKRRVAMKVMLESADPADVVRFVEEAQLTGQLEHPNIVPVHELGVSENDQLFYTMKMVRGITLEKVLELIARGVPETVAKYPLPALLTIFQKVCDALAFAHSQGVIHRDLKPENIMLDDFGVVLVMDWGLARVFSPGGHRGGGSAIRARQSAAPFQLSTPTPAMPFALPPAPAQGPDFDSAGAGLIMGTPQYMSPEQARGEVAALDQRADIYALGAILYTMLALRPPISGTDIPEVIAKVARGEIEPLIAGPAPSQGSAPGAARRAPYHHLPGGRIPDSLAAVVGKAMAFDRGRRYPTVADFQRDLTAYQNGFATSAEQAGWQRQAILAFKRNTTVAIAAALVVFAVVGFGTKAVIEGRRAERALAELKKSAPALLQLAESEAGFQRFDSALEKLDAALALDPGMDEVHWQRAWCLLGQGKWSAASDQLRRATEQNPIRKERASIRPTVERIGNAVAAGTEVSGTDALALVAHLERMGATGAALHVGVQLKTGRQAIERICKKRISDWVGPEAAQRSGLGEANWVWARLDGLPINTVAPLKGLPLEGLEISQTLVADLEPLRGMNLRALRAVGAPISDLRPLTGMPVERLDLRSTKVGDLSPLRGMPLRELIVSVSRAVEDLSPLRELPLATLEVAYTSVRDLSPLAGMKLTKLNIASTKVRDLSPLRGAPIEELHLVNKDRLIQDFTPLLDLPKLEKLRVARVGKLLEPLRQHRALKSIAYDEDAYRPVAEFWAEYDAPPAAGKQ